MKVVNLSHRPFVNQRPVVRVAWILWVLGAVFLAVSFWLYGSYWIESADIRGRLAEVESDIRQEEASLAELDQRFEALDLDDLNEQAVFLNQLIASRTFPWSALFDHLEEVLPRGVKLENVQPSLDGGAAASRTARRNAARTASRRTGRRNATPTYEDAGPAEVQLSLLGTARDSQELLAFVDALYQHPSFRQPLLRNERFETPGAAPGSSVRFDLTTLYLVSLPEGADDAGPAADVTAQGSGAQDPAAQEPGTAVGTAPVQGAAGTPSAGTPSAGTPSAGTPAAGTPAAGTPAAGTPAAGTPAAGTPSGGTPSAGTRSAGTRSAGTPSAGTPAVPSSSGEPRDELSALRRLAEGSAGEPAAEPGAGGSASGAPTPGGILIGTPSAGTPSAGTPSTGTPSAGTPSTGTPSTGTPSAGTPSAGAGDTAPAPNAGGDPRFVTPGATGTPRLGGGGGQP